MVLLASLARAGTVCAENQDGCDHPDLEEALGSTDPVLELLPGVHLGGRTVDRQVDVTAVAGAVLRSRNDDQPVFTVESGGTGSTFRGLVYDPLAQSYDGPLVRVLAAEVTVADAEIRYAYNDGPAPGFQVEQGGTLTLDNPLIRDVVNNGGDGIVWVYDANLVVIGGRFVRNQAGRGSAIWASGGSTVTVTGTTFEEGNSDNGQGNAIWMDQGTLALTDITSRGVFSGSEVYLEQVERVTITGGAFEGPEESYREAGAVFGIDIGTLGITGTRFSGWTAPAVRVPSAETVTVEDAVFHDNHADLYGAAMYLTTDDLRVDRSWFCDNRASEGGALDVRCSGSCVVTGSVFQGNVAEAVGGAIWAGDRLSVDGSTFRGNTGGAAAVLLGQTGLDMERSIVVDNVGTGAVLDYPDPQVFRTNALDGNQVRNATFAFSEETNRVGVAVVFEDGPGKCGQSVTPTDAPENDWVWDNQVGAIVDADRDGFPSDIDCDDTRPDVFPGAAETVADGTDQDCDGLELCPKDRDGDGFAGEEDAPAAFGCPEVRGDCDDLAPEIHPGASDPPYDGIDGDCAGDDDYDHDGDGVPSPRDCDDEAPRLGDCTIRIAGGCRTAPSAGWLGFLWLALIRRRPVRTTSGRPSP